MITSHVKSILTVTLIGLGLFCSSLHAANPVIANVFTADPAAFVYRGAVYLYTGHDEAPDNNHGYRMKDWLCFSSTNMVDWESQGAPLSVTNFSWAKSDAWAGQVIERK